jgi:hypothetical protein
MDDSEDPRTLRSAFVDDIGGLTEIFNARGRSPSLDRAFVRAICAAFEGFAHSLKIEAKGEADAKAIALEKKEVELVGSNKLSTHVHLRGAILFYARIRRAADTPLPNETLPGAVLTLFQIRDRITHPKRASDFTVDRKEELAIADAATWLMEVFAWSNANYKRHLEEVGQEIRSNLKRLREKIQSEQPRDDSTESGPGLEPPPVHDWPRK